MVILLIYTGSNKKFDKEHSILAKIQIDNHLDLGWKRQEIILVTDFPFIYNGITSLVIRDGNYYDFDKSSNKIPVIMHLIDQGILKKEELYWYHDFDVYQIENIKENELGLTNFDIGLTPYGYKPQWNLGSIFFKTSAHDIFKLIDSDILNNRRTNNRCDEYALKRLIDRRTIGKNRYNNLNVTYNFTKRCIQTNYRNAEKPIRVIHFHLWDKDAMMNDTALNIFMYGKNRLKMPLMTKRLINIFNKHGVK
jgi:hypothetical protein